MTGPVKEKTRSTLRGLSFANCAEVSSQCGNYVEANVHEKFLLYNDHTMTNEFLSMFNFFLCLNILGFELFYIYLFKI